MPASTLTSTSLWLNEAFATLMGECIIIEELHPEWHIHSEFINAHLKRALQLDALRSSHPIEMPCPDSTMVNQVSPAVSSIAGCAIMRGNRSSTLSATPVRSSQLHQLRLTQ
jgi:aminopeptidase 2